MASGVLLGLLAPVGLFVLRVAIHKVGAQDLDEHRFCYLYELVGSATVFGLFGLVLGIRMDRLRTRRNWYREKADHDDLTGFLSHTAFRREVARAAESAREAGQPLAILLVAAGALPGFETVRGAHSTKSVLLHVAAAARHACGKESIVGRWGGFELAILLPPGDVFDAEELARSLRDRVADRPVFDGGIREFWQVTIGGVAGRPTVATDVLLDRAQGALRDAHRSGQGIVILST